MSFQLTTAQSRSTQQTRLRQAHRQQQTRLLSINSDNNDEGLTLHELTLVQQLKLANDNLQYRLQQKQAVLLQQQRTLTDLRTNLDQTRVQLHRVEAERDELTEQVKLLL